MTKNKKYFLFFFLYGLLSIVLTQTWFVPDEYWQSLEIAHSVVFHYGYKTWEWQEGIRSAAYPLFISVIYWILKVLYLDFTILLIYVPRLFQIFLASLCYLHTCSLSVTFHSKDAYYWTSLCLGSSWILFYSMNRTIYNASETSLVMIGLNYFPWKETKINFQNSWKFVTVLALSVLIRPTSLIIWTPLVVYHLSLSKKTMKEILLTYLIIGVIAMFCQVSVDWIFYKRLLFTPYNFLTFNFIHNLSTHYGTHSWHWYIFQGLPQLFTTHLLLLVPAIKCSPCHPLILLMCWTTAIYSILDHKEFRFLLPLVPMGMCVIGGLLAHINRSSANLILRRKSKYLVGFLFATNIPLGIYFGVIHQRGSLEVMRYISQESNQNPHMRVLFLMPCHSTPFYSHIHKNLSLEFLSCEPNIKRESNYEDMADKFFNDPLLWLSVRFQGSVGKNVENLNKDITEVETLNMHSSLPTHFVFYDALLVHIKQFLTENRFFPCASFFHTHFPEGRIGKQILVWCT